MCDCQKGNNETYRTLLAELKYDPRVLGYDGEHPFQYCMDTVVPAMREQGKTPDDAEKFCGWWKAEHGEPKAAMRHLHLVACAGKARLVTEKGKEYIVVPVTALMEGVIHAVNAEVPEFVPLSTLQEAASSWNGKPVTLGHPIKNGKQCSAASPEIRASHAIGEVRNSRVEGQRLLQEAWVEKTRVKELHPGLHDRLLDGQTDEVSVGSFVVTSDKESDYKGKKYKKVWMRASGDHLAFLPGGRGACSVEMGCGSYRAAEHVITEKSIDQIDLGECLAFSALEGKSLDERMQAVNSAVQQKWSTSSSYTTPSVGPYAYARTVFDDRVIVCVSDKGVEKLYSISYTVDKDGKVTLGSDMTEVKQTYVAAAGARHSRGDVDMIQTIHDHAMKLGARCDRENYEQLSALSRVRNEGGRWTVYSTDGSRRLSSHDTEAEAVERVNAIEAATLRRSIQLHKAG